MSNAIEEAREQVVAAARAAIKASNGGRMVTLETPDAIAALDAALVRLDEVTRAEGLRFIAARARSLAAKATETKHNWTDCWRGPLSRAGFQLTGLDNSIAEIATMASALAKYAQEVIQ